MMNTFGKVVVILALSAQTRTQTALQSPCPEVFQYDTTIQHPNRWYGAVNLTSKFTLQSLWLNIELDKDSKTLKNCLGNVTQYNSVEYNIEKPDFVIKPGEVVKVQFYVDYEDAKRVPTVASMRFNGRIICGKPIFSFDKAYSLRYSKYGIDMRGCPYKPGSVESSEESMGNSTVDMKEPTGNTSAVSNKIPDSTVEDLLTGGRLSFVLPTSINNYSNNSIYTRCGKAHPQKPLVIGAKTEQGQWPWQVAVMRTIEKLGRNLNVKYQCSGTLISTRHVITGAHCVTVAGKIVDIDDFILRAGWNLLDLQEKPEVQTFSISAKQITVHPDFEYQTFKNDLSILAAEDRLIYSTWVQPACIWSGDESTSKVGTIAGWGYDVTGKHHKELTTIEMIEVDQNSCLQSHDPSYSAYFSDKIYCAKHVNGTSNCHKDSGSGMMVRVRNKWYLRGVLSFYYSPELQHACQSHALFTDVAKHLPWIKQHVYDYV